jgi:hypothetical protein
MELAIIKSLLNKDFYDAHKGAKCPHSLFSKEVGKIKTMIDASMQKYNRDLTVDEVEGLFFASDPTMTTAQKHGFKGIFQKLRNERPIGNDVAQEILSKLFQQYLGEEIANIGFDYVNGTQSTLEPLRHMLEQYRDDFLPDLNIEWDDLEIETLLEKNDLEARWTFNVSTLATRVGGVNDGHLVVVGARPNTGKTSFHASMIAGPDGFAHQGAKCVILCNEEGTHRVGARYLTAASGMTLKEIKNSPRTAQQRWSKLKENIKIKDATGRDMAWVESVCKTYGPDILVLDMGDKFAGDQSHEGLKNCAIHARQIAKEYGCAIFYMSQLSADAEGKIALNQSMMEGSKTGKASEADLMLLISKNPVTENQEEDDMQRHINSAKNKLTGWHGYVTVRLESQTGRYEA